MDAENDPAQAWRKRQRAAIRGLRLLRGMLSDGEITKEEYALYRECLLEEKMTAVRGISNSSILREGKENGYGSIL